MSPEELEAEALRMPEKSRIILTERLIASLTELDEREEAADLSEAERRLAEIDAGTATLHDADRVFERLDRILSE